MKELTLTLMLAALAMVLTATPILQTALPSAALGIAAAQNEPDGDNNQEGDDEPDGNNNDGEF